MNSYSLPLSQTTRTPLLVLPMPTSSSADHDSGRGDSDPETGNFESNDYRGEQINSPFLLNTLSSRNNENANIYIDIMLFQFPSPLNFTKRSPLNRITAVKSIAKVYGRVNLDHAVMKLVENMDTVIHVGCLHHPKVCYIYILLPKTQTTLTS